MDPDENITLMLEALRREDFESASEAANDLSSWLRKDGFPPTISVVVGDTPFDIGHPQNQRSVASAVANEVLIRCR